MMLLLLIVITTVLLLNRTLEKTGKHAQKAQYTKVYRNTKIQIQLTL